MIFDLIYTLPQAVCLRKFSKLMNSFEDVALNVDKNKNQKLKVVVGAADFHFCLGTQDVPLCTCVHQQGLQKINITDVSLVQLRL